MTGLKAKERVMDITAVKHAGRLKDIVAVLLKYGFDDVVERLEIPGRFLLRKVMRVKKGLTTHERIRLALEELGPTFIKFGQIMSLRPDFLPADLIVELRKLHDEVPPVPFEKIRPHIEKNLDQPLDEVFIHFDEEPIAAASLAQVHRAVLRQDRHPVAVKIQRPAIEAVIRSDTALIEILADQIHQHMEKAAVYNLPALVAEFRKGLTRELDYRREARHMRIFSSNFSDDPQVHIPRLFDELCTERMIVMELVKGVNLDRAYPDDPEKRAELARRGLRIAVVQILEHGFFHADPHPGNILVREDDVLCILDCGLVGRITDAMRFRLTDLMVATANRDSDQLLDIVLDLAHEYDRTDREELHRDLLDILDGYHSVSLSELDLGMFLIEISDVIRKQRLVLPHNLAVMIKALITAEGTARELNPDMDVIGEIQPLVKKLIKEKWEPGHIWHSIRAGVRHIWSLQRRLPERINQIIEKLVRDEISIQFQHKNLEPLQRTLEDTASRLTVAVIIGALIIGSSLIISAGVGPNLFGFPALGIIGYMISGVMGLWIVINVLRSRW